METTKSIVIGAPAAELYQACARLESLPERLESVRSVERTGDRTSRFVVKGPGGRALEWTAELTRLEPAKRIAWNIRDDRDLKTSGQITFNPLPHGQTELTLMLKVVSDGDADETERIVERNLRSLKTSIERD